VGHKFTLASFIIDLGSVDPQISNFGPVFEKNSVAVIDEYNPMKGKKRLRIERAPARGSGL